MSITCFKSVLFSTTLAMVSGCASQRDFYEQVVKTNMAVEEAHNRVLLLNVLRALKQQPMHFTGFSKITGPAGTISPTLGFSIPFGSDFTNNVYTFSPSFKPDTAGYELAIYDKQEFMRGFLTPATPKLLQYFLDQGWPAQMVFHLFVRRVDTFQDGNKVTLTNHPQDREKFPKFQTWVDKISQCQTFLEPSKAVDKDLDLILNEKEMPSGTTLLAFAEKGYVFVKQDDKASFRLKRRQSEQVLKFDNFPGSELCPTDVVGTMFQAQAENLGRDGDARLTKDAAKSQVFMRSPEAMVYYLGEILRSQLESTYDIAGRKDPLRDGVRINLFKSEDGKSVKPRLFYVVQLKESEPADSLLLSVDYDGAVYGIPRDETHAGRSMHILSLISQLIGLQKNATELPATTTVRIVQ